MDIIILKSIATEDEINNVIQKVEKIGLKTSLSEGNEKIIIGVIGDTSQIDDEEISAVKSIAGVEDILRILKPYKLASRDFKSDDTIIDVRGLKIGDRKIHVIAGLCTVENKSMLLDIAKQIKEASVKIRACLLLQN